MEENRLKNMIVLKDLPSNIVEEAIIILKNGTKIKKLEKIEKNISSNIKNNKKNSKDYIVKEAEILLENYISYIENKDNKKLLNNKDAKKKYNKLKKYAYITTIMVAVQAIILIIK